MSLDPQIPDIFTKEGRELFREWYEGPLDFVPAFGDTSLYYKGDGGFPNFVVKNVQIKEAKLILALLNQADRILELIERDENEKGN